MKIPRFVRLLSDDGDLARPIEATASRDPVDIKKSHFAGYRITRTRRTWVV